MNPQVTLFALLDAMERNDRESVAELLDALAQWNRRGGFLPTVERPACNEPARFIVYRQPNNGGKS